MDGKVIQIGYSEIYQTDVVVIEVDRKQIRDESTNFLYKRAYVDLQKSPPGSLLNRGWIDYLKSREADTRIINSLRHYTRLEPSSTVRELVEVYNSEYLMDIKNMGQKSYDELTNILTDEGLI